jgi:hypothetical protein
MLATRRNVARHVGLWPIATSAALRPHVCNWGRSRHRTSFHQCAPRHLIGSENGRSDAADALSLMPDRCWLYTPRLHRRVVSLCHVNAGGGKRAYHREYRGEYQKRNTIHLMLHVLDGNTARAGVVPRRLAGPVKTRYPKNGKPRRVAGLRRKRGIWGWE